MSDANESKTSDTGPSEVETEALALGWAPKEKWRGAEDQWIDAETFVKRGKEMMPLLKASNKKLQEELHHLRVANAEQAQLLKANTEAIEALKEFNNEANRKEVEASLPVLRKEVVEAEEAGDRERAEELREKISESKQALKAAKEKPTPTPTPGPTDATQTPEFKAFLSENSWFGKDLRQTAYANGVAAELQADPNNKLRGKEFLDYVAAETQKAFGSKAPPQDKVGGARGSGEGGGSSGNRGKSFQNLPQEARDACDRQGSRLVGKGRAYETQDAWRAAYAAKYFSEE